MSALFENPILIVTTLVSFICLGLYLKEFLHTRDLEKKHNELLEEEKQKSYQALQEALQKSNQIIGEAELESIQIASESELHRAELAKEYSQELGETNKDLEKDFQQSFVEFKTFLSQLKQQGQQAQVMNEETIKNRINQLFENFESRLSDFLVQTEQKSVLSIELELRSVRQLVDTYKAQQLKLIDENIIAMLEKTLSLVLGKKLSLKDQMDLVYESLEKAKVEKFIV